MTNYISVKFEKICESAFIPVYSSAEAACFDVFSAVDCAIKEGEVKLVSTGLRFEIPENYSIRLHPRSGAATKRGIVLANQEGVIDSDYRGELFVAVRAAQDVEIKSGDRIAQGEIVPLYKAVFIAGKLNETERGAGGFGSTGE